MGNEEAARVSLRGPTDLPGVIFRRVVRGADFPAIASVSNASWEADLVDVNLNTEDLNEQFEQAINFDPVEDAVVVEIDGRIVGYCKVSWKRKLNDLIAYSPFVVLLPEYRGHGIRETLLEYCEARSRKSAAEQLESARKVMEVWAAAADNSWKSLVERNGYAPSWHLFEMVRDGLDSIPEIPLPEGIEVRPVRQRDLRKIWDAAKEALRDENNFIEESWDDAAFERLPKDRLYKPELWQIAWDGDEVVGGVHNIIDPLENESLGRKWGHTEQIFVRREWRGRGIAKALISRSLKVVRDNGMDAATLDVDVQNPSRALRLYESLGYRMCREFTFYRKDL